MPNQKILSLLGLCQRANRLLSGEEMSLDSIKKQRAKLVLLAKDASNNTQKRIRDKSSFYNVPVIDSFTSEQLSKAIGKNNRKVMVIMDTGFAKKIISLQ
ncbi:MAG TPA: YlxQ-related RNA-binding protein [Candidatus Izemoplasmatales bacterium]|nr:YlxQ-related RNA-binding protein [Candidatus Izemoplasmatales bacterium]